MSAPQIRAEAARPPPAGAGGDGLRRISSLFAEAMHRAPMLVNGYSLVASAGFTAILGVAFWMAATRLYPQEVVGFGAALVSVMTTIGYVAQLNLGTVLNRFLPTSGSGAPRLILRAYAAALTAAVAVSVVFALYAGSFAEPLEILRTDLPAMAWFVMATAVWTVFALQDAALAGLRKSVVVPVENTAYAVAKILFLVALVPFALPLPGPILFAWTIPLLPVVAVINVLIFRRWAARTASAPDTAPRLSTVFRFLGWDYAGSLALAGAFGLAPMLVLAHDGAAANAAYHIAWQFAYSIYLIGRSMSVSLVAEGAAEPGRLKALSADALVHAVGPVALASVAVAVAAPLLMLVFGESYAADGTALLRILSLACIPWAVTTVYLAVERARGRTLPVAVVQLATLAVFAPAAILMKDLGALGVAVAWLAAHSIAMAGVAVAVLRSRSRSDYAGMLIGIAESLARLRAGIGVLGTGPSAGTVDARAIVAQLADPAIARLEPVSAGPSLSDGSAFLLREGHDAGGGGTTRFVLKTASSVRGCAALRRNIDTLTAIAGDARLRDFSGLIPAIVDEGISGSGIWSVETAMAGRDARRLMARAEGSAAVARAAEAMAAIHAATATPVRIDSRWAKRWIDGRIAIATVGTRALLGPDGRSDLLQDLGAGLRARLVGRSEPLGLAHGDFSPGNLLFVDGDDGRPVLSGLIDWDAARSDAPSCLDALHLDMTALCLRRNDNLGAVVIDMIASGTPGSLTGTVPAPEFVLLAWLHHVACNIAKSDRYRDSRLWIAANVDQVVLSPVVREALR